MNADWKSSERFFSYRQPTITARVQWIQMAHATSPRGKAVDSTRAGVRLVFFHNEYGPQELCLIGLHPNRRTPEMSRGFCRSTHIQRSPTIHGRWVRCEIEPQLCGAGLSAQTLFHPKMN